MKVAIQQPEHLPWIGFFNKMASCDLFVLLDNVQFKKRYFENRNRLKSANGAIWFTVPVESKGKYHQNINEVIISQDERWKKKYLGRMELCLGRLPFWKDVRDVVVPVLECPTSRLAELNISLINKVCAYLGINTRTALASSFDFATAGSRLIQDICQEAGAGEYISGPDGRNYLDVKCLEDAGISVLYHDFVHPAYRQAFGDFVSHLSILDLIANCGSDSAEIIKNCYRIEN